VTPRFEKDNMFILNLFAGADFMKNGLLTLYTFTLILGCSAVHASVSSNNIPTEKPRFSFSIAGLYLQPNASNLGYAIHTTPLPLPAPNWEQKFVSPSYSAAFDLGLQYNLLNGIDYAKLNWLHFSSNDSAAASSSPNTSIGPTYYYGPAQQFILNTGANSTVKFNIDNGNMIFGHLINLNDHIQVEPFVGLSAVYLKEDISNNYRGTDPVYGPYTHTVNVNSAFAGFGPRVGVDGKYFITNRFAITGGVAADLLAGFVKYSTDFTSWTAYTGDTNHNSTPANTSMANQNLNRIVPEVDTNISMLYKVSFDKSGSELILKAGYLYAVYFNAINQVLPTTLVPGAWEAGSVAIINQTQQQSNVDLTGPFVSLFWTF
jgi:hypothetical protein